MRIGELARRAGVSTSRIRFYEARGLLLPAARSANGYREYDTRSLEVIGFIGRAQGLGFALRDVAAHLRLPAGDGRKAGLQARLEARLAELDASLEEVRARRASVLAAIEEVRRSRRAGGSG